MQARFERMSEEKYRALEGERSTVLKQVLVSPKHYKSAQKGKQSKSMELGGLVHSIILEPETLPHAYAVWSGKRKAGKEWDAFEAEHEGKKQIVKEADVLEAGHFSRSWENNRARREVMDPLRATGLVESALQWTDPVSGLPMKARFDWVNPSTDAPVIVGLKTSRNVSPRGFANQAAQLGYHLSWAMYAQGFQVVMGVRPAVYEMVIENHWPHDSVFYRIPEDVLAAGEHAYNTAACKVRDCMATGQWPGISEGVTDLEMPGWVMQSVTPTLDIDGEEVTP